MAVNGDYFGGGGLAAMNDPNSITGAWSQYVVQTKSAGGQPMAFSDFQRQFNQAQQDKQNAIQNGANAGNDTPLATIIAQQEAARVKSLSDQGLNPDGSPIALQFQGLTDANGNLDSKYTLSPWQNVNADTSAINAYKQTALRGAGTDSDWAKAALQQQQINQAQNTDQAAQGANNNMIQAFTRLAQTGGLGGGDRARLASQAAQAGFIGRQSVARQGQADQANIRAQDESNRMSQLGTLQGMQNQQADIQFKNQQQALNVNQYNNDNLIKNMAAKNAFDANTYNQQMNKWAAGKTADAQRAAAGGGGKK
jgi:hypothetical protein